MPSPFPGMDPFLEENPLFHELYTQVLSTAQGMLQPQLVPKYVACLEHHLSEGSVWDREGGISLNRKEPDLTITATTEAVETISTVALAKPSAMVSEEFDPDELQLRKQRRIVIYLHGRSHKAVTSIELLSPSNKDKGSIGQTRYMEKRSSALHGGLHWVEIDLLRGGQRMPLRTGVPDGTDYLTYVAQATEKGWDHLVYRWTLRDLLPRLGIPLLGADQVGLDLAACFTEAYDRIAASVKVDYSEPPPTPALSPDDAAWVDALLREKGLRS